jgi:hypothetical protein
MVDEAFEGIRLSGEQRPGQFGFSQLVHALDCSAPRGQVVWYHHEGRRMPGRALTFASR